MLTRSALVLPLLLLAACSPTTGDSKPAFQQPAADTFQEGPCRAVADAVLAVGRDANAIAEGATPDAEMATRLSRNQDLIDATQPSLDPLLKPSFAQLVIGIGVVRIRNDSNTLEKSVGDAALKDYEAVVAACSRSASPQPRT